MDTKYFYVTHSELNAILNYRGGSLEGSKIYVSLFPCNECSKAIIQSGIREIIYDSDKYGDTPAVIASRKMLDAAGVHYRRYIRRRAGTEDNSIKNKQALGSLHEIICVQTVAIYTLIRYRIMYTVDMLNNKHDAM